MVCTTLKRPSKNTAFTLSRFTMYLKEGRPGRSHYMQCKQKANIWGVVPDEESRGSLPVQELVANVVNVHNVLPTSNYCCLLHLGLIYSKETV